MTAYTSGDKQWVRRHGGTMLISSFELTFRLLFAEM